MRRLFGRPLCTAIIFFLSHASISNQRVTLIKARIPVVLNLFYNCIEYQVSDADSRANRERLVFCFMSNHPLYDNITEEDFLREVADIMKGVGFGSVRKPTDEMLDKAYLDTVILLKSI